VEEESKVSPDNNQEAGEDSKEYQGIDQGEDLKEYRDSIPRLEEEGEAYWESQEEDEENH